MHPCVVRSPRLLVAAVVCLVGIMASGCGGGASGTVAPTVAPATAASAGPSAGANATLAPTPASSPTANPTLSATAVASPSSGSDIDPCSLLISAEVTTALEHPAPTPLSLPPGHVPGVFNDGTFVTCRWLIPYPTVPENRSITVTVCACQVAVTEFDAWAMSEAAETNTQPIKVTGIGERAYLFGLAIGSVFLYHEIAVEIISQGVPGLTNLPDATLDKNAKPFYTGLAKKVISRLPRCRRWRGRR